MFQQTLMKAQTNNSNAITSKNPSHCEGFLLRKLLVNCLFLFKRISNTITQILQVQFCHRISC